MKIQFERWRGGGYLSWALFSLWHQTSGISCRKVSGIREEYAAPVRFCTKNNSSNAGRNIPEMNNLYNESWDLLYFESKEIRLSSSWSLLIFFLSDTILLPSSRSLPGSFSALDVKRNIPDARYSKKYRFISIYIWHELFKSFFNNTHTHMKFGENIIDCSRVIRQNTDKTCLLIYNLKTASPIFFLSLTPH